MIFDARYLKGAVKIFITGPIPERFINLCMAQEIHLWGIKEEKGGLAAWLSLGNFFKIRPLARKSRTKIKVVSFLGIPFVIKRAKKRKMLLIGAIIFLFIIHILSSYIWFIEITGAKLIPQGRIRQIAAENGLKRAVNKAAVDSKKIEREILLNIPEISWAGISFTGTQAIIEVVEKTIPKQESKMPADISALKDGVIDEIIVLNGQGLVKKGDTVKKGDILIKGVMPKQPAISEQNNEAILNSADIAEVRAKGIVKAKIWYESYAEAEKIQTVYSLSGNRERAVTIKINGREFVLKKPQTPSFSAYEMKSLYKRFNEGRNSFFDVELSINSYQEIIAAQNERTAKIAGDEAKAKALEIVRSLIPENAQILARNFEIISDTDNIVRIKITVETLEDIGQITDTP